MERALRNWDGLDGTLACKTSKRALIPFDKFPLVKEKWRYFTSQGGLLSSVDKKRRSEEDITQIASLE